MTLSAVSAFDNRVGARHVEDVSDYPQFDTSHTNHREGNSMLDALGKTDRRFRGDPRAKTSIRDAKNGNMDWIREHAARESTKDIADKTGLTPKAVENLRRGKNKINFDNLVEWCRNDPAFAAAFAEHIGLILPGEAEFAGALTNAFNAFQRRKTT